MPIYTGTSVEGCLDASKRAKIVYEITWIQRCPAERAFYARKGPARC